MQILEHLFLVGEFPERARLLSGLTLEQVTLRPDGATHSIYEELWHVVAYQQTIVASGDPNGDHFPSAPPEHEQQWHDLVKLFLDGARAAVDLAHEPERLAREVEPGVTLADELNCVAIHNAYHLGKIVALRQRIGAWPPPGGLERRLSAAARWSGCRRLHRASRHEGFAPAARGVLPSSIARFSSGASAPRTAVNRRSWLIQRALESRGQQNSAER